MALYKGNIKVSGVGKGFSPENSGTEGQVLTKTNTGYGYCNIPTELPSGGSNGQVLTKTNNGNAWCSIGGGYKVDIMIVGGGGGGGSNACSGGGGGGEVKFIYGFPLSSKSNCVIIGTGGNCGTGGNAGCNGGNSSFANLYALGGGGGGGLSQNNGAGCVGGNGGGGAAVSGKCGCLGGMGLNGNPGASSRCSGGGGGGGACGIGGTGYIIFHNDGAASFGGPGISTDFGGVIRNVGGGGDGGDNSYGAGSHFDIFRGICYGGGVGGYRAGCPGTANTGGGGAGGGSGTAGGKGGSGIVIVRYPNDGSYGISSSTGGTVTTCSINGKSYKIHTFTSNGTFCITG